MLMMVVPHRIAACVIAPLALVLALAAPAAARPAPEEVLGTWYRLVLELVRHTPTYSPPVASRAFAYLGVTAYEAAATGRDDMESLAGQLNDLSPFPAAEGELDRALVLHTALSVAVADFFGNTGPTGQRAMSAMDRKLGAALAEGIDADLAARSVARGKEIAAHVHDWSLNDGGAQIVNLGFPRDFALKSGPQYWVPTSAVALQQLPLLPGWGSNRTFAMPDGASCPLPPPPEYSEDEGSAFRKEAEEVLAVSKSLTDEQKAIARFWSDDPMLSPTPPGHWISIVLQIAARDGLPAERTADALARVGVAVADAFIGCWRTKFEYDLLRPVTYIRRLIDPKWQPLLITPPFPEYPSGHSSQSGAAAAVLTAVFGENFAFTDATHEDDGIPARSFASFDEAATEAAVSRLYGGIHFRAAIERGLDQGRCIGAHAASLRTFR